MAEISFSRVLSVSSEDPRFPASSLLQPQGGGRWLSATGSEKQISVVLELGEARPIHSLHIGNCGSAFVEVLLAPAGGDYEVLVPTAAFLSPSESRQGAELKRVRFFSGQSLVRGVASKSWERLRLVCSQPYCQSRPFGLSFVRVFSPPEDKEETTVRRLGPFRLLEESSSSSQRPLGALFYQRPAAESTPVQACPGPSYAAAALQSSPKPPKRRPPALAANGTPPSKQPAPGPAPEPPSPAPRPSSPAPEPADSARNASSSTHKASSPAQKALSSAHASSPAHKATNSTHKASSPAQKALSPAHASSPAHKASNPAHKASSPAQKAPSSSRKASSSSSPKGLNPAHKAAGSAHKASSPASKGAGSAPVLGGVVFALSGFQNPLRSQLREAALGLGAAYSPDWSEACTHLVSAFPRTPKASRARALGGVLVGPSWIWDCQKQQRRLPCGPYLLAGSGSASDAEEDEEEEPAAAPPPAPSSPTPEEATPPAPAESPPPSSDPPLSESGDSGSQSEGEDPYGGSTEPNTEEEEEEEEEEESIPTLPNFFEDKTFLLHGDFPPGQERLLQRYLTAFGGTLAPYMNDSVTHVVTAQDWDPAFEEALELRPSLTFVRPRWLLLCAQQQRPLPAQPFAVVPAP